MTVPHENLWRARVEWGRRNKRRKHGVMSTCEELRLRTVNINKLRKNS